MRLPPHAPHAVGMPALGQMRTPSVSIPQVCFTPGRLTGAQLETHASTVWDWLDTNAADAATSTATTTASAKISCSASPGTNSDPWTPICTRHQGNASYEEVSLSHLTVTRPCQPVA
jgi:hypothetical protein